MKILVHTKHTTPDLKNPTVETQKETIVERIERALKHVAPMVRTVDVHIEDETPGSPKFDGKCKITVHFEKGNPVAVEGHGENFHETVADGVKKVQHAAETACRKKIDKKRRVQNAAT